MKTASNARFYGNPILLSKLSKEAQFLTRKFENKSCYLI